MSKIFRKLVTLINLKRLIIHSLFLKTNKCKLCTKFNLVTDLQIMLSNVPDSRFHPECITQRVALQTNCLQNWGVNEKLLLFLAFVLSETELSKLSEILDLSDLSELSAKHDLTISKSMPIQKFMLVILRSPKCN